MITRVESPKDFRFPENLSKFLIENNHRRLFEMIVDKKYFEIDGSKIEEVRISEVGQTGLPADPKTYSDRIPYLTSKHEFSGNRKI